MGMPFRISAPAQKSLLWVVFRWGYLCLGPSPHFVDPALEIMFHIHTSQLYHTIQAQKRTTNKPEQNIYNARVARTLLISTLALCQNICTRRQNYYLVNQ